MALSGPRLARDNWAAVELDEADGHFDEVSHHLVEPIPERGDDGADLVRDAT